MLTIRLRRMGSRHRPFYRVVVSDSRRTPRASALDEIGHYDPRRQPAALSLDLERFDHWVERGAKPSDTVARLSKKVRNGSEQLGDIQSAKLRSGRHGVGGDLATAAAAETEAEAPKAAAAEEAAADEPAAAATDAAADEATAEAS
ncbi:MAG: 30S ribosomal protein S16 [Acidobacteriota bacterium]